MLTDQNVYFASANTTSGFSNYFAQVFNPDEWNEIHILKGGPGTGKSSFLRKIARAAGHRGYHTDLFLCSSDPSSLDGVIIPEKKLVLLDGTSPHTTEPLYPGAVDCIDNLGEFWDRERLIANKSKILPLIQEKSRCYRRAYRFLKAAGEIHEEMHRLGLSLLKEEKFLSAAQRIMQKIYPKTGDGKETVRLIASYNHTGYTRLESFEKKSDVIYVFEDCLYTAVSAIQYFLEEARERSLSFEVSYSPLLPHLADALYLPHSRTSLVIGKREYEKEIQGREYHYVNMERFIEKTKMKENKMKIRFAKRCTDMMEDGAREAFVMAKGAHDRLESIYVPAMDFVRLDKKCNEWIERLFH